MARWRIGPFVMTLERVARSGEVEPLERARASLLHAFQEGRITAERYEVLVGRALERHDPTCAPSPKPPVRSGAPAPRHVRRRPVSVTLLVPER